MHSLFVIFYGMLGAIVGSFLNVVILRHNTGNSLAGRSGCLSCNHVLAWYDLVPVFSFVLLRGRCRYCGSAVSWQYPAVELLTALLFAGVAWMMEPAIIGTVMLLSLFDLTVIGLLVVIAVYDMRHTIIPDVPVYILIVLSFGYLFVQEGVIVGPMLSALLAGPAVALPLAAIWFFSQGRAMGFGDAKLALALGWLLGLEGAATMLLLSFWIGAAVSVGLLLLGRVVHEGWLFRGVRQLTIKSEIAFGPFLIAAYLIVFFFDVHLIALFTV